MSNIARRGDHTNPATGPQPVQEERYTVLLLDENQLDRLLSRPHLKSMSAARTVDVWPRWRRLQAWGAAVAVAALAVTAAVWLRASSGDAGEPSAPAPVVDTSPAVATGPSFSVQVASFAGDRDARSVASRLVKAGLPAFAWRLEGTQRDVLVGPFVSIDEAETAQRDLGRKGYPRTRLHVDERLRTSGAVPSRALAQARPAVLLVAAPGRLALVFELPGEPQQVSGQRIDATTFDVTTSALQTALDAQEWSAPADTQLIKHISVEADARGIRGLSARVTLSETAVAKVRLDGTRVYVDVSRAQLDFEESPARPAGAETRGAGQAPNAPRPALPVAAPSAPLAAARGGTAQAPVAGTSDADIQRYQQAIAPVFARFEEIQPFLRAAVGTPTPEVLAALAGTFGELEQTLQQTDVPRSSLAPHGLLTSAVQLAKGAVSPGFTGDRMSQVREATAQFQAAKARLR